MQTVVGKLKRGWRGVVFARGNCTRCDGGLGSDRKKTNLTPGRESPAFPLTNKNSNGI
jgi:hypothetical protein